jgi:hypothetical protein
MSNITDILIKLKTLFEHPNTPANEAETAKKLFDRLSAKHNISPEDLNDQDLTLLEKAGVKINSSGEYIIDSYDGAGFEAALYDIFKRGFRTRKSKLKGDLK